MNYQKKLRYYVMNYRQNHNGLRFGQDLWNKMNAAGYWESPEANALFFISDEDLAKLYDSKK